MNRYEALIAQLKTDGTTDLQETWLVCLTCLDAWLGKPGDKCRVCQGETKPTPFFMSELAQQQAYRQEIISSIPL